MEDWRFIDEFPGYSISDQGRVRNDETGYYLSLLVNQRGIINVGLTKNRIQHKRAVSVLVANAFLPTHPLDSFDTPINLDGDRRNNRASNLMWRPRWFASEYFKQFLNPGPHLDRPLEDQKTGDVYKDSWEVATTWGLLDRDVYIRTLNRTYVWPTYQTFRILDTDTN